MPHYFSAAFYLHQMNLSEKFYANWKQNFAMLNHRQCHILLAVSGGIDSMVLADILFKNEINFSIAHCNFQLRGHESEGDEMFVKALAEKYKKEFFVKKFDTSNYAAQQKISIQEAARDLRYEWFQDLLKDKSKVGNKDAHQDSQLMFHALVTAHNANDNIETIMLNFFRGTGLQGLKGIVAYDKKRKMIRPLLFAKREEIMEYANENNLPWREDSSNASDKYTRNFFRHQVIPLVKQKFAATEDNLLRNIDRLKEENMIYENAIDAIKNKLIEQKGNEIHIPVLKLKKQIPLKTIVWEIFKTYDFASNQVDEIIKLMDAENSSYIKNEKYVLLKNRAWLIISPNEIVSSEHILIEKNEAKIEFDKKILKLETLAAEQFQLTNDATIASLDLDKIIFPLMLRRWKTGDYFYPLGMKKKKKLSKFFIDNKLSKTEKENIWVIEMNKKIVWIVNHRIDERFKILPATKNILKLSIDIKKH